MGKAWFAESGLAVFCDNGKAAMQDDCPCGCPSFEGRLVIYVDKHATGTGDGSSWTDAYTDIQTAINAHPKKEIQIKGYGENDCYPAGITLAACVYLKGVDTGSGDMWISGNRNKANGIIGNFWNNLLNKIENITVKDCIQAGFCQLKGALFINCTAINNGSYYTSLHAGFYECNDAVFDGCVAMKNRATGFYACQNGNFSQCSAPNNSDGGWRGSINSTFLDCTALKDLLWQGSGVGFGFCRDSSFIRCSTSNHNTGYDGNENSSFTDCVSSGNDGCGFIWNTGSTFTNCTTSGDCTTGEPSCTPGNPSYNCDEV